MEVKELEGFEECDEDVFIDAYEIDRATLTIELGMKSLDIYFRRERDDVIQKKPEVKHE